MAKYEIYGLREHAPLPTARFFGAVAEIAHCDYPGVRAEKREAALRVAIEILYQTGEKSEFVQAFRVLAAENQAEAREGYRILRIAWMGPTKELKQMLGLPLNGRLFPKTIKLRPRSLR